MQKSAVGAVPGIFIRFETAGIIANEETATPGQAFGTRRQVRYYHRKRVAKIEIPFYFYQEFCIGSADSIV